MSAEPERHTMKILPLPPEGSRFADAAVADVRAFRPAPAGETPARTITLRDVLRALRRRWWLVVAAVCVTTAGAVYLVHTTRTTYASSAVVRLKDSRKALTGGLAGGAGDQFGGRVLDPVQSQVEVLTSRTVAAQVADTVTPLRVRARGFPDSLLTQVSTSAAGEGDSITIVFTDGDYQARDRHARIQAVYGDTVRLGNFRFGIARRPVGVSTGAVVLRARDEAAKRLQGRVRVRPRQNTDIIDVAYSDYDSLLAQRVTQAIAEVFQNSSATAAKQESVRRRQFLEKQLRHNDSLLQEARTALGAFRSRQQAYSTKAKLSTEQADLNGIELRRADMDADRRMFGDMLTQLRRGGTDRQQIGAMMSAPTLASNPVLNGLYSQLTRYQSARDSLTSGRFGATAQHPDVQRLDTLIADTETKMVTALSSVVASLDARIEALDTLRARNATAFPALTFSETEEARLEEQEQSAQQSSAELRSEYEKARLAEAVEVGQVEIVDDASAAVAVVPVGPVRKIAFGVLLGLLLGGGLAFVLDRTDTSIRGREQVLSSLGVPELAVIPPVSQSRPRVKAGQSARLPTRVVNGRPIPGRLQPARLSEGLILASEVHSIAAEAYRLLRTNLLFSLPDGPLRTVLVTSPAPGDGKTTVAANLAIAFAHQGMRVLLIDADMRRGRVHDLFRVGRDPGLSQVLTGAVTFEAAVRPTPVTGLFILPTGVLPDDPNELVGAEGMRTMLGELAREFAMVVVDSPPVMAASDAAVMSTICDATVVVVRAGQTHEEEARHTLRQLSMVGGNVVGAVLNDPDAKVGAGSDYYYYSSYYGKE
jgi:capsular exopolysaccharide synthesis family protein